MNNIFFFFFCVDFFNKQITNIDVFKIHWIHSFDIQNSHTIIHTSDWQNRHPLKNKTYFYDLNANTTVMNDIELKTNWL